MQKNEWLLAQHNKNSIDKLRHFAQYKKPRPAAGDAVRVRVVTHRIFDTVVVDRVNELGPDAEGAHGTEDGQHEVPADEGAAQIELLAVAHQASQCEYDCDVGECVVEAPGPVLAHPFALRVAVRVVEELALVVEEVRVVEACG